MCGICGKVNFDAARPADRALLRRMSGTIRHRGPDGGGEHLDGPAALGHRRLSIIDLSTGDQPMSNEDGRIWVVFNGEIYNYRELRRELQALGHRFRSTSDTEVIVHLYETYGDACVTRLRGMFAFALWDGTRQRLLLARDRVGIKPLYVAHTPGGLAFASEMKALLEDPEVSRDLDPATIDTFLSFYHVPGTQTMFKGIAKLGPGHLLTVERARVTVRRYWDLEFPVRAAPMRFDAAVQALQTLLDETVRDHLISDVPVGVLLSGGVDSTGVLRYAATHAGQPLHSFTLGFDGSDIVDERPYARIAAKRYGTIHHELTLGADEFRDFLPDYVWHMEEPVCEPPAISLFHVARLARQHAVKVLLSGEGGDEAFGGYPEYRNLLLLEGLKKRFGGARGLLRSGLRALGAAGFGRAGRYADFVEPSLAEYYYSRVASPATPFNRLKPALYRREFAQQVAACSPLDATRALFEHMRGQPLLNQMLYVDSKSWLPDDLLVKADKMTMATSVELRVPFLDHRVLEFAASLPPDHKVRGGQTKRVLRAALRSSVPPEILQRPKAGFPTPYARWLRTELRELVHDTLLAPGAHTGAYFVRSEVAGLLDRHHRDGTGAKEVFSLLVLELWHQRFTAPRPAAAHRDAEVGVPA